MSTASNLVCWTRTNDVHGFGGVPHSITTVDRCQTACISNSTCVAVDWEPNNTRRSCWILTSTATGVTLQTGVIAHYELNRTNLSQYCL